MIEVVLATVMMQSGTTETEIDVTVIIVTKTGHLNLVAIVMIREMLIEGINILAAVVTKMISMTNGISMIGTKEGIVIVAETEKKDETMKKIVAIGDRHREIERKDQVRIEVAGGLIQKANHL